MKRLLALLLAVLTVALLMAGCARDPEIPNGMKEASDPSINDFRLFVPEDWVVDLQTGAVSAYCSPKDPSSVNVMAWSVSAGYTPDQWWETSQREISQVYADFQLESVTDTSLDGVPAKQFVWSASLGSSRYRFLQVTAVRNSGLLSGMSVYVFTFGSLVSTVAEDGTVTEYDRFASHLEEVQSMLAEFLFD